MFQQFTFGHVLFMASGALVTLQLVALALAGGIIGSTLVAAMLLSRFRVLRWIAGFYIYVVQGTPILVVLFMTYFGLPRLGLVVDPFVAMGFAFTIFTSAFMGEIWRGSIAAVPRGQWESAHALGLKASTTLLLVIVPQALRIAIPPTIGFIVQLVKGTSVVAIVGISELTRDAQIVSNATFKPLPVFAVAALFYFAINFPLTSLSRYLERKLSRG